MPRCQRHLVGVDDRPQVRGAGLSGLDLLRVIQRTCAKFHGLHRLATGKASFAFACQSNQVGQLIHREIGVRC